MLLSRFLRLSIQNVFSMGKETTYSPNSRDDIPLYIAFFHQSMIYYIRAFTYKQVLEILTSVCLRGNIPNIGMWRCTFWKKKTMWFVTRFHSILFINFHAQNITSRNGFTISISASISARTINILSTVNGFELKLIFLTNDSRIPTQSKYFDWTETEITLCCERRKYSWLCWIGFVWIKWELFISNGDFDFDTSFWNSEILRTWVIVNFGWWLPIYYQQMLDFVMQSLDKYAICRSELWFKLSI